MAAFKELLSNAEPVLSRTLAALIRIAKDVLSHPSEEERRRLRLSDGAFSRDVVSVRGALSCLSLMGFRREDECFVLPKEADLSHMESIVRELKALKESAAKSSRTRLAAAGLKSVSPEERQFEERVRTQSEHVLIYEEKELQAKARSMIPLALLTARALDRVQEDRGLDNRDSLCCELLCWFKFDFFSWMDAPSCCGKPARSIGHVSATAEDLKWGASRVEGFRCDSCSRQLRFPRYNHPGKLLDTRQGRCGEWANCFTLLCRAMGFEARLALDWTDHVWTEVWSQRLSRWVHTDPCENAWDKPLLYEHGWKKQLSYVVAFSFEQAIDVTWRYSSEHAAVLQRRTLVDEKWLLNTLTRISKSRQASLPRERIQLLQRRLLSELVEFLSPRKASHLEAEGRQSGALEWRMSRGETSDDTDGHTFSPREGDALLEMSFNSASNDYTVNGERVRGWKNGVFRCQNVVRKEEHDWKMVYLARSEGTNSASISWRFSAAQRRFGRVEVHCAFNTFQSGSVQWSLANEHGRKVPFQGTLDTTELEGSQMLVLEAQLTGGDGDVAWQHTQLFRIPMAATQEKPLYVRVALQE